MIIFEKIKYKNFLSAGNVFMEVDLCSHKSTLVSGKNGGGKSTLIESIFFALYGKPFRKIKKATLINSINKKECLVELDVSIASKKYKIRRGMKPEVFEIYENEVLMDQNSTNSDYQEFIDNNITKTNINTIKQIFILGSATYKPFMELDAKERRSVIEDVLDIKVFSEMSAMLKSEIEYNKEKLGASKSDVDLLESKKKFLIEQSKKLANDDEREIEGHNIRLSKIKDAYIENKEATKNLEEQRDKISEKLTSYDIPKIKERIDKRNEYLYDAKNKIKNSKSQISFFDSNETCPTCTQVIDSKVKNDIVCEHTKKISNFEESLVAVNESLETLNRKIDEYNEIKKEVDTINKKLYELNVNKNSLTKEANFYKSEIDRLKNKKESLDIVDTTDYDDEIQAAWETHNNNLKDKEVLLECGKLLKDDGIKSLIIKKYIPLMNSLINKYLDKFDLFINFHLDENFDETIKSRYRDDFSYNNFSQGEKLRINLAIMLAWREIYKKKNKISSNLLILDETLDGALDEDGISGMLKTLNEVNDENIIVVSHRGDQIKDGFDRHIKMQKVKDFSVMVIE